jgi:LCP family protein required for cell wall assembly
VAAAISFAWPGAGHILLGYGITGAMLAVSQLLVIALAVLVLALPASGLVALIVEPVSFLALLALNGFLLLVRLWAVLDAYRLAGADAGWWQAERRPGSPGRVSRSSGAVLVTLLIACSIAAHGSVAFLSWQTYDTLHVIFSPDGPRGAAFGGDPSPSPTTATGTAGPGEPSAEPMALPTQRPRPPWAEDGRLTVLLIGSDAGPGRWKLRTDTMILLTIDVDSGQAAMFGFTRYMTGAPLPPPLDEAFPDGFDDLLNALWVYVDEHPGSYPGEGAAAPYLAVQDTIALIAGVQVDGMAVAELNGFVRAVDAIGGIDIDVPAPVYDASYPTPDGTDSVELSIPAGLQHLDGFHALAYARTRHQDGDYARMGRQQVVVRTLFRELSCDLVTNLPEMLSIMRDTLWTNLPLDQLPGMIGVVRKVDIGGISGTTLTPPDYPNELDADNLERIRAAVRDAFAVPQPTPSPSSTEAPAPRC